MAAKVIGKQAADILTREVHWPHDHDWRGLLSQLWGEIQIDREDPEQTIEQIIEAAAQIAGERRRFMAAERAEAKANRDLVLVEAIDDAREWIADLKQVIKTPEFAAGVNAWIAEYIE
uniref:Uncharacterized protein n=1 Tax=mine drainage metagenome TaxID=410659 RepID=E6PSG6_9ZZZZ